MLAPMPMLALRRGTRARLRNVIHTDTWKRAGGYLVRLPAAPTRPWRTA